jgi:hypothetical protein
VKVTDFQLLRIFIGYPVGLTGTQN